MQNNKRLSASQIAVELVKFLDTEAADFEVSVEGYHFTLGATMFAAHLLAATEPTP